MVLIVWGLVPLLIPITVLPIFGLYPVAYQIFLLRAFGAIVLLNSFVYFYIYKYPHKKLTKYLLLFSIADNAGVGIALLIATPIYGFPWGIWVNIPFQLFFGYWFWRFYREGKFRK